MDAAEACGAMAEVCRALGIDDSEFTKFENAWKEYIDKDTGLLPKGYSYYEGRLQNQYLVWQHDGRYTWIGPTKLDINIGYLIHRKVERPSKLVKKGGDDAIKE